MLARHAARVIAVDPAALDPRVLLPNVTHLACKAEDAVGRIQELAAGAGVDLLVSGARRRRRCAALLVGSFSAVRCKGATHGGGREGVPQRRAASGLPPTHEPGASTHPASSPAPPLPLPATDINKHPLQVLQFLRPLLPLLRPGGAVVLTLKWYGGGRGRGEEWQAQLLRELGPGFDRVQLLWLLANTQHEQTAIAFKSEQAAAAPAAGAATA